MKFKYIIYFILIFQTVTYAQVSNFKNTSFIKADGIAKKHKGFELNNLSLLAHKLTNDLDTDVEKFRAIYTWVCLNIQGDDVLHNKVSRKRSKYRNDSISFLQWNKEYKKHIFKKLLKHKKTMCTGYAYLIKELSYLANIKSVIINGYGRSVDSNVSTLEIANHSWNAVKLNNKWYLCDATWSSGFMDGNGVFIEDYNDGYFLTEPSLFSKNHFPLELKWLLTSKVTAKEFVKSPLVYGEAFKYKIAPIFPKEMNVSVMKDKEVKFSFKSSEFQENKKLTLIHYLGAEEKTFDIYDVKNKNGLVTFNSKFKYRGKYDIHLKIDNDIVATYILTINK